MYARYNNVMKNLHNKEIGKLGEEYAKNYLSTHNYVIVKQNHYGKYGEIDIVAIENTIPKQIVFIEVKTRTSDKFGSPDEALTKAKIERMIKSAILFIKENNDFRSFIWRVDLIGILLGKGNFPEEITHIKNIPDG